jgi:hypothetical protein
VARSSNGSRVRVGALSLAVAGVLFILYPAIRPFSDEVTLQGAQAFASSAWIVAHVLAMLGFILATWGLLALHIGLGGTSLGRLMLWALVVSWLGVGLTLPFYGAEAFGLHAIGQEALRQQSAALLSLANAVRTGPGLPIFGVGLVLLGVGAIMVAIVVWRSPRLQKWSGVPFALGFALYIPQFVASQPVRVAHGVLVAAGCIWIAAGMWRHSDE